MEPKCDRELCGNNIFRGKNVCTGEYKTPMGDFITCPCACHAEIESHPQVENWDIEEALNVIDDLVIDGFKVEARRRIKLIVKGMLFSHLSSFIKEVVEKLTEYSEIIIVHKVGEKRFIKLDTAISIIKGNEEIK